MNKKYLIEGKPLIVLFQFCLPMIIGNLFQQFYTMTDSAIVGRFVSEYALAAVGASSALINVFICIAVGAGVGASVIISYYFGESNMKRMKTAMNTALLSFLALSIVLMLICLMFGRQIIVLLNTPIEIETMSIEYLRIYAVGIPFLFMYNILSCLFNAVGKSRIPLYFLIFSSILNIMLDLLMVVRLNLGIAGAAWATVISQIVSVILSYIIFRKLLHRFCPDSVKPFDLSELRGMFCIALPSIFQQSTISIGMLLVQSVVNGFGAQALAGFSAAMRVEAICVVPMNAIGNALSSYTAQNLGAKKIHRIRQGLYVSSIWVLVFSILIFLVVKLFSSSIMLFFLGSNGTELALSTGRNYLQYVSAFFILIGMKMTVDGLLRGAGDMKYFLLANLLNLLTRVLLSLFLAPVVDMSIIWIAVPIGWFVNLVISGIRYLTGKWKYALVL